MDTFPIDLEILGVNHTIDVPFKQGFDNLRNHSDAIFVNAYLDLTDHILSSKIELQDFQIVILKAKLANLIQKLHEN
jgi:hypothetical protein